MSGFKKYPHGIIYHLAVINKYRTKGTGRHIPIYQHHGNAGSLRIGQKFCCTHLGIHYRKDQYPPYPMFNGLCYRIVFFLRIFCRIVKQHAPFLPVGFCVHRIQNLGKKWI